MYPVSSHKRTLGIWVSNSVVLACIAVLENWFASKFSNEFGMTVHVSNFSSLIWSLTIKHLPLVDHSVTDLYILNLWFGAVIYYFKGVLTSSKGWSYMLVLLPSTRWRWCPVEYLLVSYSMRVCMKPSNIHPHTSAIWEKLIKPTYRTRLWRGKYGFILLHKDETFLCETGFLLSQVLWTTRKISKINYLVFQLLRGRVKRRGLPFITTTGSLYQILGPRMAEKFKYSGIFHTRNCVCLPMMDSDSYGWITVRRENRYGLAWKFSGYTRNSGFCAQITTIVLHILFGIFASSV